MVPSLPFNLAGPPVTLSHATLGLLADSGWYEPTWAASGPLSWCGAACAGCPPPPLRAAAGRSSP
jgi:hypothetical protein